jgi:alpha-L-fucosidase
MKWGMFVCWSFSTFSGNEWTPGVKDISLFAAKDCDTDQWARTAKKAGMAYICFLTKHHDGFCLWDTKTTDRKVTNAPLGRDVLAELRKSCDKYGIKLALYYSEGEWAWPGGVEGACQPNTAGKNPEMKKAQLKELLTQYGPIEYIWFDYAVGDGGLSHAETDQWVAQFQPNCLPGYNAGPAAGRIRLGEMGHPAPLSDLSGAGFNHGHMKGYNGYLIAEFAYPILPPHNGGAGWFYSLPKHDSLCLPANKIYQDYLGAVKFGNIFSVDVGPNYEGKLRDIDIKTLQEVGKMIRHQAGSMVSEPLKCTATASNTWSQAGYEAEKANDSNPSTRWGAAENSRSGWLELALNGEKLVRRAMVDEAGFARVQKFDIQAKIDGKWKSVATGTTIGAYKEIKFAAPVKAQVFRLTILEANEVPTIGEFQLFDK